MRSMLIAIKMTIALTLLTGILYPLAMFGVAQLLFPVQANGSLVYRNGEPIGSSLIAQNFQLAKYFHPRPSAAGNNGYDPTSSGGSNLGPTNKSFVDTVRQRLKDILKDNPGLKASDVPVGMVTASGSGLDPEIGPAGAYMQVARVAKARGISESAVRALIRAHTRHRWAGFLGEPGVNVLELNLALDGLSKERTASNR